MLNIIIAGKAFVVSTNETETGAGRIQSLKENQGETRSNYLPSEQGELSRTTLAVGCIHHPGSASQGRLGWQPDLLQHGRDRGETRPSLQSRTKP
jgi:hypothetical protein